jgi:hypothetical protein
LGLFEDRGGGHDRGGLTGAFELQIVQCAQVVLHFLICRQNRAAIVGDLFIVGGAGLRRLSAMQSAIESRDDRGRSDRPQATRRGDPAAGTGTFKSDRAQQAENREVRGAGDANLRVCGGDTPFGRSHVRATFEQRGGQAGIDGWPGAVAGRS